MHWLKTLRQQLIQHKYAINAKQLGDPAQLPWSNLGYWDEATSCYPQACRQLAEQLAQAVQLNSNDRLLDLGCGQGASLLLWQQHYQLQHIEAVELQAVCVLHIQKYLPQLHAVSDSFLNLRKISFQHSFDVVLCIDAAYHSNVDLFLDAVCSVLNPQARLGFHYLIFSEKWHTLTALQKQKYRVLLKAADVHLDHLMSESCLVQSLQDYHFIDIQVRDLSSAVLQGFANYFQQLPQHTAGLDAFKIRMTAKLCEKLYADGLIKYVQISAKNNAE